MSDVEIVPVVPTDHDPASACLISVFVAVVTASAGLTSVFVAVGPTTVGHHRADHDDRSAEVGAVGSSPPSNSRRTRPPDTLIVRPPTGITR